MKKQLIIFLLILSAFLSCDLERTVEIDNISISPQMVINGLIYANADTNYLYITESQPIYNDTTSQWNPIYKTIKDADVELNVNEVTYMVEYMKLDTAYVVVSDIKAGDEIYVESNYNSQPVSATVKIPNEPEIISIEASPTNIIESDGLRNIILFNLKIKDAPVSKNYYRLLVSNNLRYSENNEVKTLRDGCYSDDPLLVGSLKIFQDTSFDGQEYNLTFYTYDYSDDVENDEDKEWYLSIKLQSISEDLYKYYSSLQRSSQSSLSNQYSEPILIHSNVKGGLGILGACNEVTVLEYNDF